MELVKQDWRFIHTGLRSSAENMAIDEALLISVSEGKSTPVLRFYGWNPATLSIGYFQKAEEEVDFTALKQHGLGFVRRPTGGRAVLHDQELTYSMIVSEKYPGLPKGVTEAHRVLSEGLLLGFRNLKLDAQLVTLTTEEDKVKYAALGSAACFDSPSWYELVVEGRKIAGSAQTRQKGVVLQHGSILLDMDIDLLFELLRFPSERVKARLRQSFREKAVAINDLRKAVNLTPVTIAEIEPAFQQGIAEGLGIRLQESELSPYEKQLAGKLIDEKYANRVWNFRR